MKKLLTPVCATLLFLIASNDNKATETGAGVTTAETTSATNSNENKEERNKQTAMESLRAVLKGNADEALKNATRNSVDYYDGSMPPAQGLEKLRSR